MGNLLRIVLTLRWRWIVRRRAAIFPTTAVLPRIDYADHPLGTGMDMHMSDFDGLLVTAPVLVQCLDEVELEAQQPSANPMDLMRGVAPRSTLR